MCMCMCMHMMVVVIVEHRNFHAGSTPARNPPIATIKLNKSSIPLLSSHMQGETHARRLQCVTQANPESTAHLLHHGALGLVGLLALLGCCTLLRLGLQTGSRAACKWCRHVGSIPINPSKLGGSTRLQRPKISLQSAAGVACALR